MSVKTFRQQPTTETNLGLRKNCGKINVDEDSKNENNVTPVWISTLLVSRT